MSEKAGKEDPGKEERPPLASCQALGLWCSRPGPSVLEEAAGGNLQVSAPSQVCMGGHLEAEAGARA